MQNFILGRKNHITIVSAILIIIAFVSKIRLQKRTNSHMGISNCFNFGSFTYCDSSVSSIKSQSS